MASTRNEPVVVIGLGRFGRCHRHGVDPPWDRSPAIDESTNLVQSLSGQLTQALAADCTDIDTLRELGVDAFYRAVVAVGTDIEASILITSLPVELEVEDVWAKATTAHHGRILQRVGATHVVYPEREASERVAPLVSGQLLDYMQVDSHFAIAKIRPPHEVVGVPLGESKIRSKYGITVVAVKSGGADFTDASSETELLYEDIILVTGRVRDIDRLVALD